MPRVPTSIYEPTSIAIPISGWRRTSRLPSAYAFWKGEFFNIFNQTVFGSPSTNVNSATFGEVFSQTNQPRLIQIAANIKFLMRRTIAPLLSGFVAAPTGKWIGGQITSQGVSALDENRYTQPTGGTASYLDCRERVREYYGSITGYQQRGNQRSIWIEVTAGSANCA
jgi:hypothetical protein